MQTASSPPSHANRLLSKHIFLGFWVQLHLSALKGNKSTCTSESALGLYLPVFLPDQFYFHKQHTLPDIITSCFYTQFCSVPNAPTSPERNICTSGTTYRHYCGLKPGPPKSLQVSWFFKCSSNLIRHGILLNDYTIWGCLLTIDSYYFADIWLLSFFFSRHAC